MRACRVDFFSSLVVVRCNQNALEIFERIMEVIDVECGAQTFLRYGCFYEMVNVPVVESACSTTSDENFLAKFLPNHLTDYYAIDGVAIARSGALNSSVLFFDFCCF